MRTIIASYFSLENIKIYWILVFSIGLFFIFGDVNTPEFMLPMMASLISAGLVLHQVNYNWASLITAITLAHVISFPLATFLVLSLSDSSLAIEPEIWQTTPLGLWAMVVGMFGLAFGVRLSKMRLYSSRTICLPQEHNRILTPIWFNLGLVLLIIPVVVIYIMTDTYYHKDLEGTESYNYANANAFGAIGYLVYIVYCGVILQIRRYLTTKNKRDLHYLLICIAVPVIAMLPSGSRANTIVVCVIALMFYLQNEVRVKAKFILLGFGTVLFLFLTLSIEAYRISSAAQSSNGFTEKITTFFETSATLNNGDDSLGSDLEMKMAIIGRRLSDVNSVGYLVSIIPESFPYRGFEDIPSFIFYLIPTAFRPNTELDYNYDALLMSEKYQFRADTGGSSPMMVIGDLYERFGWAGIFFGMAFISYILSRLDLWIHRNDLKGVMIWSMVYYAVINMHTYSILKIFTLLTRQMLIFMIVAYFLEMLLLALINRNAKQPSIYK